LPEAQTREWSNNLIVGFYATTLYYSKPKVTLASHLWILSKLIFTTISDDEDDGGLNILMKYIITTCHKKMERRFKHDLSDRHFQSLKNVENFTFNPELQVDTDLDKILNDRAFITGFVSRTKLQPKLLASLELSPIPNIQRMCDNLPHESEPFQLYTSETCTEFHNLVVGLLVKFKKSCFSLAKEKGNTFRSEVASMIVCGHTLLRIARGSAFEMHLQNIASLLEDHRTEISMPKDDAVSEELLPVLLSITDEGQPIPLWKTYRDWMQLMVVYFDAAKILTTYAASQSHPFKAVSFKILATPPVDDRFLPYPELLTDSLLFPVADASGKPVKNEEILEFLDKGFKSLEAAKRNEKIGGHIMRLWEKCAKKEYKQISKNLSTLKGLLNSESVHDKSMNKDIEEILELLLNWNNDQDNDTLKNNITDKIRSLNDELAAEKNSNPFPTDLVQALKKFKGTCHCECCFASILHEGTRSTMVANEYKDLLEETKVGYSDFPML
jgi:DNA-binding transcriptional regulator GbsR (MarR family)